MEKVDQSHLADFKRASKYGFWTGTYDLRPIPIPDWSAMPWYRRWYRRWRYKALYNFENDKKQPLTYHHPDGYNIRPDNHFVTDMGSVPQKLQGWIPWLFSKDLWLRCYILHDSAYAHNGLWFAKLNDRAYCFCMIERKRADDLLALMIKGSGGGKPSSAPIWFGVRLGGWASWGKGDARKKEGRDGHDS